MASVVAVLLKRRYSMHAKALQWEAHHHLDVAIAQLQHVAPLRHPHTSPSALRPDGPNA